MYYYAKDAKEIGPLSGDELMALAEQGEFDSQVYIRPADSDMWKLADGVLAELRGYQPAGAAGPAVGRGFSAADYARKPAEATEAGTPDGVGQPTARSGHGTVPGHQAPVVVPEGVADGDAASPVPVPEPPRTQPGGVTRIVAAPALHLAAPGDAAAGGGNPKPNSSAGIPSLSIPEPAFGSIAAQAAAVRAPIDPTAPALEPSPAIAYSETTSLASPDFGGELIVGNDPGIASAMTRSLPATERSLEDGDARPVAPDAQSSEQSEGMISIAMSADVVPFGGASSGAAIPGAAIPGAFGAIGIQDSSPSSDAEAMSQTATDPSAGLSQLEDTSPLLDSDAEAVPLSLDDDAATRESARSSESPPEPPIVVGMVDRPRAGVPASGVPGGVPPTRPSISGERAMRSALGSVDAFHSSPHIRTALLTAMIAIVVVVLIVVARSTADLQGDLPDSGVTSTEIVTLTIDDGEAVIRGITQSMRGQVKFEHAMHTELTGIDETHYRFVVRQDKMVKAFSIHGLIQSDQSEPGALNGESIFFSSAGDGWEGVLEGSDATDLQRDLVAGTRFDLRESYPGIAWPGKSWEPPPSLFCSRYGISRGCDGYVSMTLVRFVQFRDERCAEISFDANLKGKSRRLNAELSVSGTIYRSLESHLDLSSEASGMLRLSGVYATGAENAQLSISGPVTVKTRASIGGAFGDSKQPAAETP